MTIPGILGSGTGISWEVNKTFLDEEELVQLRLERVKVPIDNNNRPLR